MSQPPGWAAPEPGPPQPGRGAAPGAQQNGWGPPIWGPPPGAVPPRPRPGIIPLRPLGLGELYDGAFQAIRTNPMTMIGVSALVIAATTLITTVPQAAALTDFGSSGLLDPNRAGSLSRADVAGSLGGLATSLVLPALLTLLAVTVVTGLLIIAVSGAVLGRKTPPGELWRRTRRRIPGLVGLALIVPLTGALVAAVLLTPGVLLLVVVGDTLAGVLALLLGGLLSLLSFFALAYGFWALAAPALLLEDLPVVAALRRSARLIRGSFWRVLGIMVLTAFLVQILSGLVSLPFTLVGTVIGFSQSTPYGSFLVTLVQLVVTNIGTIVSGAVLYPFSAAVTALLYIDLRMRREGLDVELMRSAGEPV